EINFVTPGYFWRVRLLHIPTAQDMEFNLDNFHIENLTQDSASKCHAAVISATDYSPFGAPLAGRTYQANEYRFGFNGKEKDNETFGDGNIYDYGFRVYDPRKAKFLSVDPLTKSYPWYTPYQFAGNMPIAAIDLDGLEEYLVIRWYDNQNLLSTTIVKVPIANQIPGLMGTIYVELDVNNNRDLNTFKQFTKNNSSNDKVVESRIKWDKVTNTTTGSIFVGNYENGNRPYEQNIVDDQANKNKKIIASDDPENATRQPISAMISSKTPVKVFFDNNKFNLGDVEKKALKKVANVLKAYPSLTATITGNTDNNNNSEYNLTLGNNRAKAVSNYLTATEGVLNSLTIESNGDTAPSATNATSAGRAENRNTQVKINYPQKGQ
ncbi:MAG: OmpA family protein, partial [Bacteroidota bacterium]|nr:OmpA family protein [Bacteroidota bacterium]